MSTDYRIERSGPGEPWDMIECFTDFRDAERYLENLVLSRAQAKLRKDGRGGSYYDDHAGGRVRLRVRRLRPATTQPVRPEHDFTQSLDEWEDAVLSAAAVFTTVRFLGRGQYDRREFAALAAAVADAGDDRRAMVYAVTAAGRSVMVPRSHWAGLLGEGA